MRDWEKRVSAAKAELIDREGLMLNGMPDADGLAVHNILKPNVLARYKLLRVFDNVVTYAEAL